MKRIIVMVLHLFYIAPFWFYHICKYGKDTSFEIYSREFRYQYLQKVTTRVNRGGRVLVDCFGLENLPQENGFILFPNHQGLFDGLVFLETLGRPFSVVMKKETENIFLLKQVRVILNALLIDRDDIRQSLKVIQEMSRRVKAGENFLIFAEGTRSRKGNEIGEFKAGSFKSAMHARCPIVPVALIDSFQAFDTNSAKKITIQIHYLEPLYYEEYQQLKSHEIAQIVETRIRACIAAYAPQEDMAEIHYTNQKKK